MSDGWTSARLRDEWNRLRRVKHGYRPDSVDGLMTMLVAALERIEAGDPPRLTDMDVDAMPLELQTDGYDAAQVDAIVGDVRTLFRPSSALSAPDANDYVDETGTWDEQRFQSLIFATARRGYSLDQVDDALDEVVAAIRAARTGRRVDLALDRLEGVRFSNSLRGYDMAAVDAAIDQAKRVLTWWNAKLSDQPMPDTEAHAGDTEPWDERRFQSLVFPIAFRGYSLNQVDDALDEVVAALRAARSGGRVDLALERLEGVRFSRSLRGYDMAAVDEAIDQARRTLEWWNAKL